MSFIRFAAASLVGAIVAATPAAAVEELQTYAQFFQKTNLKALEYASYDHKSMISVTGTSSLLIGLAFLKPGFSPGDLFDTIFSMSATSYSPVTATDVQFE